MFIVIKFGKKFSKYSYYSFTIFNVATRKFKITFMALYFCWAVLADSASKHLKTISNTECNAHKIKMGIESMEVAVFSSYYLLSITF